MALQIPLMAGLALVGDVVVDHPAVAAVTDAQGNVTTPAVEAVTHYELNIKASDGTVALALETNWSPSVFNGDFPAWLRNFVAKINAFLTAYIAKMKGPQTPAELEATLTAELSFDGTANQVSIKQG